MRKRLLPMHCGTGTHILLSLLRLSEGNGKAIRYCICVPTASVAIKGSLSTHTRIGSSGKPVHRHFYSHCGTVVLTEFEVDPVCVCVEACSLDEPSWLRPEFHLFISSKQPWGCHK